MLAVDALLGQGSPGCQDLRLRCVDEADAVLFCQANMVSPRMGCPMAMPSPRVTSRQDSSSRAMNFR